MSADCEDYQQTSGESKLIGVGKVLSVGILRIRTWVLAYALTTQSVADLEKLCTIE